MPVTSHLKSLQALELAIRVGSLTSAANKLGITPAAVGQRIRALEDFLGIDLLMRGRSGLQPTPELEHALADLQSAFAALDRATSTLDFQRASEIQIVADTDWADLWLIPRLASFREEHPNIKFCINGAGDIPLRLSAPDLRIIYGTEGEPLFTDALIPVSGSDNLRRIGGREPADEMEGMPLLHLKAQESPEHFGWAEWFQKYGHRRTGVDRGIRYPNARLALEAVRQEVGYLLCGLSFVEGDLKARRVHNLYPLAQHLKAQFPYGLKVRGEIKQRPQVMKFVSWLQKEARSTRRYISQITR